jgi:hypothetical protein
MFIKINGKTVIQTSEVSSVQKFRVEGPYNAEDWHVVMKDGKKHRVMNYEIDKLIEALNGKK